NHGRSPGLIMDADLSCWLNALYLRERAALSSAAEDIDIELAREQLAKWRSQTPFRNHANFHVRLPQEGLDEATILRVLGTPDLRLGARPENVPEWLHQLRHLFLESPESFDGPASESVSLEDFIAAARSLAQSEVVAPHARLLWTVACR